MSRIVVRSSNKGGIPENLKYPLLSDYSKGLTTEELADKHKLPVESVRDFIKVTISTLSAVRETRAMGVPALRLNTKNPVSTMNEKWLADVEQNVEMYAYHYATTGNNVFALKESGLDKYLPSKVTNRGKGFVFSARGRYLRAIPDVFKMINQYRDQRVKDADIGRTFIQSELLEQLEELKELGDSNPRTRGHLLKVLDLLGKSEGVFTETLNINDTSTKTGMDILMEKVKGRVNEETGEAQLPERILPG